MGFNIRYTTTHKFKKRSCADMHEFRVRSIENLYLGTIPLGPVSPNHKKT